MRQLAEGATLRSDPGSTAAVDPEQVEDLVFG
jgi:hypothetical protein